MAANTNTIDDVAAYLVTQGLGTLAPGTWLITLEGFAEKQDKNIMISAIGGGPPITASQTKNPTFQILLRGEKDDLGNTRTKAREILDALAYIDETRIAAGTMYNMIRSLDSEPVYMGPDEKKERPIYSMNFEALRSTVNSV